MYLVQEVNEAEAPYGGLIVNSSANYWNASKHETALRVISGGVEKAIDPRISMHHVTK
jgi:hypothetical protein